MSSSKNGVVHRLEREYSRIGSDFRQYVSTAYDSSMNK